MQKFTARQYLQMDIAANHSQDKADWSDRLAWFQANCTTLRDQVKTAKEPALYFAGILAWEACQKGEPSGYPVSLDATASGLQLLACLTGDRSAAQLCNVVPTGSRKDAYTVVYNEMTTRLGETSKISREQAKDAVMTSLYGSTAVPKEVFGEGLLLQTFYNTMGDVAPAVWELNEAFLQLWDPTALSHDWVMPDGFQVVCKTMTMVKEVVHFLNEPFDTFTKVNAPVEGGRALGANVTHSVDGMVVREMQRRCNYDPKVIAGIRKNLEANNWAMSWKTTTEDAKMVTKLWDLYKQSGYLSARILNHLTYETLGMVPKAEIEELLNSLPEKPFDIMTIHDCFRSLPNYCNDLREQYNRQLMLVAQSNMLGFILSQLTGRNISIGKLDPTLHKDIMQADYALS